MKKITSLILLSLLFGCSSSQHDPNNKPPKEFFVNGFNIFESFYEQTGITAEKLMQIRSNHRHITTGQCRHDKLKDRISCFAGAAHSNRPEFERMYYTEHSQYALNNTIKINGMIQAKFMFERESGKIIGLQMYPDGHWPTDRFDEYMESMSMYATDRRYQTINGNGQVGYLFGEYFCFAHKIYQKHRDGSFFGCVIAEDSEWLRRSF